MKFLERFWFGCGHCHTGNGCPVMDNPEALERHELTHGGALVGTAVLVFLLPLAAAIGGAFAITRWWSAPTEFLAGLGQAAGAVAGFFVGVGLARLVMWIRQRNCAAAGGVE